MPMISLPFLCHKSYQIELPQLAHTYDKFTFLYHKCDQSWPQLAHTLDTFTLFVS